MLSPRCAKARTTSAVTAALAAFVALAALAAFGAALAVFGAAAIPSIHAPLPDWVDFKNAMPLSMASSACANVTGAIGTRLALVLTRRITGGGGSNEMVAAGIFSVVAFAAVAGAKSPACDASAGATVGALLCWLDRAIPCVAPPCAGAHAAAALVDGNIKKLVIRHNAPAHPQRFSATQTSTGALNFISKL